MNIKYLYIVILLAINGSTFSQSKGIIVYRILTEKLEIQDNEALIAADFYKTMNSIGRVQDSLRFNLEFNEYESIFYLDKKSNFGLSNEMGYNSLLKKHGSIFYRNEESKSLIEQVNSDGYYLVHYKIGDIEWELSKENKIINGYRCFKAVSRIKDKSALKGEIIKQIEAWFCTELGLVLGRSILGDYLVLFWN